jgi:hypothetical protein
VQFITSTQLRPLVWRISCTWCSRICSDILHNKIHKQVIAVLGKHYKEDHDVGFDKHGPLGEQNERDDVPMGQGIVNIVGTASAMAAHAARVAGEATPAPCPRME